MPQLQRSEIQRPRTAPAPHRASTLDLGPLHRALPRGHVASQQGRDVSSSTPREPGHGKQPARSSLPKPRTPRQASSDKESTRAGAQAKRPSTSDGSRNVSVPARWGRPTVAESKKLFSDPTRRAGDSKAVGGARKGGGEGGGPKEADDGGLSRVARLPPDLLWQCFTSIESLYYVVNCASVCRAWREALTSDTVWKVLYVKWWHPSELTDSCSLPMDTKMPPQGYDSWRGAFIARFQDGKKEIVARERAWAVKEDFLLVRQETDTRGKPVFDCAQGDGMQKMAERLSLSFSICLNRGRHMKIQGKGKIEIFQSSCIVRYPSSSIGNLDLSALKSIEVTATSDKLLRVCPVVELTRLPTAAWEAVSVTSRSPGPLRLLQRRMTSGVSLIVGTLTEEVDFVDGVSGTEQVLLIVVSFHLSELLWKLMKLGEGPSSQVTRRVVRDELDPRFGLHDWNVSLQFHTFGRNIWTRDFHQVFWNPRESISGERAVFVLMSQHEVFSGVLKLPWKSEAFSGALRGVYLLDITLWDGRGEIAWQTTSAVRIDPSPLAVVEFGINFDGERVHTHVADAERGVSVAIEMCVPLNISYWQAAKEDRPIIAITNLQLSLTSKFLTAWCGVANI